METIISTKNIKKMGAQPAAAALKKPTHPKLLVTLRKYAMKGKEIDIKILREKLRAELGTTSLSADLIEERRRQRI